MKLSDTTPYPLVNYPPHNIRNYDVFNIIFISDHDLYGIATVRDKKVWLLCC